MTPYEYNNALKNINFVSWVPTTLTSLSFDFVGDSSNLDKKKSFILKSNENKIAHIINFNPPLSDKFEVSIKKVFFPNIDELRPITYVFLQEEDDTFKGHTEIYFLKYKDFKKSLKNKIKYLDNCSSIKNTDIIKTLEETLENIVFKSTIEFNVKKDGEINLKEFKLFGNFKTKEEHGVVT